MQGEVILVGAGPGDPKLITVAGLDAVRAADAIAYDRLSSPDILSETRRGCELVYVGKACGRHSMPQEQINETLAELASRHALVIRLKGGDPFVFGRGGEELEFLRSRGIKCSVIPGVTSAISAAESFGIPVTHRGVADRFTVINGHGRSAVRGETRVYLMGLGRIGEIMRELLDEGAEPSTGVAVISDATSSLARCVSGTIADIESRVAAAALKSPATIIVGDVVARFRRRVLVTKIGAAPSRLAALLRERGAEADELQLGEIMGTGARIDWTGVTIAVAASRRAWDFAPPPPDVRRVDSGGDSAGTLAVLEATVSRHDKIVCLKGRNAPDRFAALARHCRYDAFDVYENVPVQCPGPTPGAEYDAVYFTCASSVKRFFSRGGEVRVACAIGEETAATIRSFGIEPRVASAPTFESLALL